VEWETCRASWCRGSRTNWAGTNWARTRSNSSVEGSSFGSKVVSTGSHNRWLISWDHGTIGMCNQGRDASKGSGIS